MKQFLTAFVVIFVAVAFSGCNEPWEKSTTMTKSDKAQPASNSDDKTASSSETPISEPASSQTAPGKNAPGETGDILYGDKFPEVLKVVATSNDDNKWRFNVTLSSKYDSPERYADAWRVLDEKDQELGVRVLGHDHAGEQPFTRSETIEIPSDIKVVFVEGRDQANGWSGQRFEYPMPSKP